MLARNTKQFKILRPFHKEKRDIFERVIKKVDKGIKIVYLKVIFGIKKNPKEELLCQELVFI